jgi:hypothetical protein
MNRPKFTKICRSAMAGDERYLENTESSLAGKLLSCSGDKAEVDILGKHETWSRSDCEEFDRSNFDYQI